MGISRTASFVVVWLLIAWPLAASAQSSIAGVVRDESGAVLPGVTVEAASPALIEKVRAAVTDGQGLYRIVDLRPGLYTVTFTLPGFNTLSRDGIQLPAEFTATVDAQLSVGALEETITVTGAAPLVDIRSSREQTQFEQETLESVPGTGRLTPCPPSSPGADADPPRPPQRRRHQRPRADDVQRAWHAGGAAGGGRDEPPDGIPESGRIHLQHAHGPGGRRRDQRHRRRPRFRRDADEHDAEGRGQHVLGNGGLRLRRSGAWRAATSTTSCWPAAWIRSGRAIKKLRDTAASAWAGPSGRIGSGSLSPPGRG